MLQHSVISRKLGPVIQIWLAAIRESFILMLPLAMLGAIALLMGNIPLPAYQHILSSEAGQSWLSLNQHVWQASYGAMASILCALVGFRLARKRQDNNQLEFHPLIISVICVINFHLINIIQFGHDYSSAFGANGILKAIIIAIFSVEFFTLCNRLRLLKLTGLQTDFDHLLHQSLNAILPSFVLVILLAGFFSLFNALPFSVENMVASFSDNLRDETGSTLPQAMLYSLLNQVLWFFGVHGANVLESMSTALFSPVINQYTCMAPEVSRDAINLFVHTGGSGATLGLLLAILWHAPRGDSARIAKYAMLPAWFNINEIVLFGLPIVLNPVYFLPFVLAPLVQMVLTFIALKSGLLVITANDIAWSTPPVLSGFLYTAHGVGALWQLLLILVGAGIYLPFVKKAEQHKLRENQQGFNEIIQLIESNHINKQHVSHRADRIGMFARRLLKDFNADLHSTRVYLQYQPKVDLQGKIYSVEALIRWQHPSFGLVPAHAIVSLCEENKDILQLGRQVLSIACETQAKWQAQGINIVMAVNLSPMQLSDKTLPEFIAEQLQHWKIQPQFLELELTEGQAIKNTQAESQMLERLMGLGLKMAIDDFGMGYTSLRYLMHFRANTIKLDGSLTRYVTDNSEARHIIESISFLSKRQQMHLVAEYVENNEQRKLLQTLGCDGFQGYFYSQPLDADACLQLLHSNQQQAFDMTQ